MRSSDALRRMQPEQHMCSVCIVNCPACRAMATDIHTHTWHDRTFIIIDYICYIKWWKWSEAVAIFVVVVVVWHRKPSISIPNMNNTYTTYTHMGTPYMCKCNEIFSLFVDVRIDLSIFRKSLLNRKVLCLKMCFYWQHSCSNCHINTKRKWRYDAVWWMCWLAAHIFTTAPRLIELLPILCTQIEKKNKKLIVIPTLTGFYVRLRYVNIVQGQTLNSYNSSNVQLSVGLRYSNSHQFGMWFVTNVAANNIVVLQQ